MKAQQTKNKEKRKEILQSVSIKSEIQSIKEIAVIKKVIKEIADIHTLKNSQRDI